MPKKVLLVDDTPGGLTAMRTILTQPSLSVLEAASGREALEIHRRERADLIVMDSQMRGMDGVQVTRMIRADPILRSVSIVLVSDGERPGLREKCLAAGANEVIARPFRNSDLAARIWQLLNVATRKRTGLLAHVEVADGGAAVNPFVARILDVSTTGLLLEADVPLTVGRTVSVQFFVPGSSTQVKATAKVARQAAGTPARWGVRFTLLDPSMRRIVNEYVGG